MSQPRCKTCTRRGDNCRCGKADLMTLIGADREPGQYRSSGWSGRRRRPTAAEERRAAKDIEYREALGFDKDKPLARSSRLGTC